MDKKKQLFMAIGLGAVALLLNKWYLDKRISDVSEKEKVSVVVASSQIEAGTKLSSSQVKTVEVPKRYAPVNAIRKNEVSVFVGQDIAVNVPKGDYILESFFAEGIKANAGRKLSDQIQNDQLRAITIPVDENNSLSRSVVAGDHIDIQFSLAVPGSSDRASVMFLQDVPVLATGTYSAAEQEGRSQANKRYASLTLLLPVQDAMRLSFARQAGQITVLLRGTKSNGSVEVAPIAGVKDILTQQQREVVDRMASSRILGENASGDQIRNQLKELLEKQRNQERR